MEYVKWKIAVNTLDLIVDKKHLFSMPKRQGKGRKERACAKKKGNRKTEGVKSL